MTVADQGNLGDDTMDVSVHSRDPPFDVNTLPERVNNRSSSLVASVLSLPRNIEVRARGLAAITVNISQEIVSGDFDVYRKTERRLDFSAGLDERDFGLKWGNDFDRIDFIFKKMNQNGLPPGFHEELT